ncbi:MAG: lytic transglycosylase domain-containing protein [Verrucomicrobia bacterium]|nr:lytic transglycosylase domain-containing protein [Verrucomicrobiota bacterium]
MEIRHGSVRQILRYALELGAVVAFSFLSAVGLLMYRSKDPVYVLRELKDWANYRRYDSLIVRVAAAHGVDPRLVKAVIWRESRFQSDMQGRNGERGLMQVSEIAAREWALANNAPHPEPAQLLDPETNVQIGTWYLSKALQRWNGCDDAVPFALAEYNAGRSRVDRWVRIAMQKSSRPVAAETFQASIPFPSTARYVRTILARYDFYKRRGPLRADDRDHGSAGNQPPGGKASSS